VAVIAFDVNETLLDLRALDPLLGGADVRRRWFGQMLQIAFVGGLTGRYVDFSTAQRAALKMLDLGQEDAVLTQMRRLPPHPDVKPALDLIGEFTLVALTNSPLEVANAQLEFAHIAAGFDAILSADQVRALKPRAEAYQHVANTLDVPLGDIRLVAAHGGTSRVRWRPAAAPRSCVGRAWSSSRSAINQTSSATTSSRSPKR
jgi:2-haloacid dehalogenase